LVTFTGVNHLAMVTGDMDATIRFWRDLLGMRLVAGLGKPGFRHYFFQLSETDLVAFFEWPEIQPMPEKDHGEPVVGPFIFDHVAFGVETEEELWELKDKLEAGGFDVSDVIDHGFIHSIYSFDPNGIPIEFSVNVQCRNIRRNPVIVDVAPSDVTLEGAEPIPAKWPPVTTPTPLSMRKVYRGAGSELFHGKRDES
jgi:catechol 2,3-dioxygenase-like lactoylglutathione lyase family enzyme